MNLSDGEWQKVEDQCDCLETAVRNAATDEEGRKCMALLLSYFDSLLSHRERRYDTQVFIKASALVSSKDRLFPDDVWIWLRKVALQADESRQVLMRMNIFEIIVEEPVEWEDEVQWQAIRQLFTWLFDDGLRWAIYDAYKEFPEKLPLDVEKYCRRLSSEAREVLMRDKRL